MSLLNCVPCVVKMCQRALRVYVLTCLTFLRAHVPCVLMCQRALRAFVLTCQRASFDVIIFSFATIVAEVAHTVDKVQEFNYCLSSVT